MSPTNLRNAGIGHSSDRMLDGVTGTVNSAFGRLAAASRPDCRLS
ncbi:hypothetical protein [Blastochloris sulfoviridis]|nr:hypothetical protein [Blastochloris sulfoviridis]